MNRTVAFLLAFFSSVPAAYALDSVKLTDVVKSSGSGDINLLKDVTPVALEAYRKEGAGALKIAVDVNENAEGLEKASCQGVAFESVVFEVTVGGVLKKYSVFSTETKALIAPLGSPVRAMYYTVTGDTGSNRITTNSIQAEFDSVVTIPVDIDLSQATAAVVRIKFLTVNPNLGDPENFYDFTNGFEDLALVNAVDGGYFNTLAPGRTESPGVILTNPPPEPSPSQVTSTLSYPSATTYYSIGYEDLFPNVGDYDFNDLVVAYRVNVGLNSSQQVVSLSGTAFPVSRGAGRSHDWRLRIGHTGQSTFAGTVTTTITDPVSLQASTATSSFSGELDMLAEIDTRKSFPAPAGCSFTNTEQSCQFVRGPRFDFSATVNPPLAANGLAAAPFDPYLFVRDTGYEIHLPGRSPSPGSLNVSAGLTTFKDSRGYPFAVLVPPGWSFPWERVDLGVAYPKLSNWVQSSGSADADWYKLPDQTRVRAYGASDWQWSP